MELPVNIWDFIEYTGKRQEKFFNELAVNHLKSMKSYYGNTTI